jgi:sec-independent protein translocase protein TatA
MGIGSLGFSELLVIFVIVLVFFGPRRFPEIARSMGHAMREFRRSLNQIQRELEDADPRSSIPGRDFLDDLRKPAKWLDSSTPPRDRPEAARPSRAPGAEALSGDVESPPAEPRADAGDPAEQLPMFQGQEEADLGPPNDDTPAG